MPNPTPDIGTTLYVTIANALLADDQWPVYSENFVRYDTIEGIQVPDDQQTADSDYPRAILEGPTGGTIDLTGNDQTFATHAPEGSPGHIEPGTWTYKLKVISGLMKVQQVSALTLESINAIRKVGAKLNGTPGVTGVKARWREREGETDTDNMYRIIVDIEIMISTEFEGSTLTGA